MAGRPSQPYSFLDQFLIAFLFVLFLLFLCVSCAAADFNPPSYDQVMRGGEAYQKQAPYNPNFTGQ